jgi:inner membrane protein
MGVAAAVAVHAYHPYLPPGPLAFAVALAAAAIGGLLPDLDADESLIRHKLNTARSQGCVGWLVSKLMPSHRGITHSGLAALACALVAWRWPVPWVWALCAGYVSHILADALTRGGVPVLWPVRWRVTLLPLHTGGAAEQVLALVAAGGLVVYGLRAAGVWWVFDQYWRVAVGAMLP